jgi:hypothetical protein
MIEASLSLVVGFAAYTAYVIVGDEIRANRAKPQPALKPSVSPKPSGKPAATAPKPVAPSSAKPMPSKAKLKPIKASASGDPIANISKAIMANLTKNGPATLSKLSKELKVEQATMRLAAEKLIYDKKATSIIRGGHPALALYN